MVWTDVLSCTTCFFRYNKSKQQGGFPCLQGNTFFCTFCFTVFFSAFLLSKWSKFPLNVQVKSKYLCIQLISIGALSFQWVVLTDYRLPECRKKAAPGSNQRGFLLTYKKGSIASDILLLFITVMRFCASAAAKKKEHHCRRGGTTSQHCHVSVCVSGRYKRRDVLSRHLNPSCEKKILHVMCT